MAVTCGAGSSQLTLTHRLRTRQLVWCPMWWPEPLHGALWLPALPGSFHECGDWGSWPAPGCTGDTVGAGDSGSPRATAPAQHSQRPGCRAGACRAPCTAKGTTILWETSPHPSGHLSTLPALLHVQVG